MRTSPVLMLGNCQVSDSANFGSGGTSSAATVVNSSDSSCFSSTQSVQSSFVFNTDPLNQIVQCTSSRLWWDPSDVQGDVRFYGIIPGGDSFNITVPSDTTQESNEGTGFDWVPSIRGGTTLLLGAGDDRSLGAGGSVTYIVSQSSNTSCLDSSSPSSTAGSPAGGSYPTSTAEAENGGSSSGSSSSGTNVGAIVGGVIAGIVVICAFVLALVFLRRRKRKAALNKERTDLFTENERPGGGREAEMEHLAPPEPYIVPSDAAQPSSSEYGGASSSGVPESSYGYGIGTGAARYGDRRQSQHSLLTSTEGGEQGRPSTPGTSAGRSTRKSAAPPVLRPVNIIQHEDAGAPPEAEDQAGEAETEELPPAYTNIRRD